MCPISRRTRLRLPGNAAVLLLIFLSSVEACLAQTYTITTVAGKGPYTSGADGLGDGGPALTAPLNGIDGLAVDSAGNIFIADSGNNVIRKVSANGIISVVAGNVADANRNGSYYGDGGPAVGAGLYTPMGIAVDSAGSLYIADWNNRRVRKVSAAGIMSTVAGGGSVTTPGGPATQFFLNAPIAVALDAPGNIYVGCNESESGTPGAGDKVFKVTPAGTITLVGGGNTVLEFTGNGNLGDGGPATSATFSIAGMAGDANGNLYIADVLNSRIRKISTTGTISTVAGSSTSNYSGDGGPATSAGLNLPYGVALDSGGDIYIADSRNYRIRKVTTDGNIATIAGFGVPGSSGDGGPATSAAVNALGALAVAGGGGVYISDNDGVHLLTLSSPPQATPPSIASGGIVSASAFGKFSSIAPGSWIEIYGSNLATDSRSWTGADFNGPNAPASLDGTQVTIGGQSAFIDYISPLQVNAQVPSNVGTGSQSVVVTTAAGSSASYAATVNLSEPGLLAPPLFAVGGNQYVAALFSDGSTYVMPPGAVAGVASRRARIGDAITLYGVGFGPVTPAVTAGQIVQQANSLALPLTVMFGSAAVSVTYDGLAPNAIGLYQFNVVVPSVPASDLVPVTFNLGGAAGTQKLYIAVQ